jgi:hypothetical protein
MSSLQESAHFFLNETVLSIADVEHRLLEVELYHHSEEHPDPFVHRHAEQQENGTFYFHKSGTSYRGGTFKGMDITLSEDGEAYTSFLVRSFQNLETGEIVTGPCCCVNRILELTGFEGIQELVTEGLAGNRSVREHEPLKLVSKELKPLPIYSSPRIGLYLTKTEAGQPEFFNRPYRFVAGYESKLKGSVHTLVGLIRMGLDSETILKIVGSKKEKLLNQYFGWLEEKIELQEYFGRREFKNEELARLLLLANP